MPEISDTHSTFCCVQSVGCKVRLTHPDPELEFIPLAPLLIISQCWLITTSPFPHHHLPVLSEPPYNPQLQAILRTPFDSNSPHSHPAFSVPLVCVPLAIKREAFCRVSTPFLRYVSDIRDRTRQIRRSSSPSPHSFTTYPFFVATLSRSFNSNPEQSQNFRFAFLCNTVLRDFFTLFLSWQDVHQRQLFAAGPVQERHGAVYRDLWRS